MLFYIFLTKRKVIHEILWVKFIVFCGITLNPMNHLYLGQKLNSFSTTMYFLCLIIDV